MGSVLDRCWWKNDFHALSTVSDNPNFFDNGKSMHVTKASTSIKSAVQSQKQLVKKKVKFTDSCYINFLESMDDQSNNIDLKELIQSKDGKTREYFCSPYLKAKMIKENIRKVYKIGKCLGTGQFGSVRIGTPFSNPEMKYAIKSIPREADEEYIKQLEKEFRILKEVDHPNIIKFYETYQDQKYFHFVMEHWEGGELFDVITKRNQLITEDFAARIIRKLCSAIAHLHDIDICHRDLKPENIMFKDKTADSEIKLIDFGLSTFARKGRKMRTKVGTPFYVAPEVLQGEYRKSWDMWSIGVITYLLLCGYPPFNGKDNDEIFDKIEACKYTFPPKEWSNVSKEAKFFIKKLLVSNPKKRMTPLEALADPWLSKQVKKSVIYLDVLERLRQFQAPRKLHMEFLLFLSNYIDSEEIKKIRRTFEAIDVDHSGCISIEELKLALADVEDSERIKELMENLDFHDTGEIKYSEFLAATIDKKYIEDKETIKSIFNHFDTKREGVITSESLRTAFQRGSKSYTEEEVNDMIYEFTGKHEIDLDEFNKLITNPI